MFSFAHAELQSRATLVILQRMHIDTRSIERLGMVGHLTSPNSCTHTCYNNGMGVTLVSVGVSEFYRSGLQSNILKTYTTRSHHETLTHATLEA